MILELLTGGASSQYGSVWQAIITAIIYIIAAYLSFWLYDVMHFLFTKMFCKKQKVLLNPLLQLKSWHNAAAALCFILFGVCWKQQQKTEIETKPRAFWASVFSLLATGLFAALAYTASSLLSQLSGASYYSFAIAPLVVFLMAMFMANTCIFVASFLPLVPFMLGNIIKLPMSDKTAEKYEKLGTYSTFVLVILAAFLSRSGTFEGMYLSAKQAVASILGLIF